MPARILIIEDNPGNMDLMAYLLEAFGHTTVPARDGEEGVALALRGRPDLIVCDIHLPRLDGYGVLRALKQAPELAHTPILAVTALAMVGDREKIVAAGFDGYLSKPIVPEQFVGQVESFLPEALRATGTRAEPGATEPTAPGTGAEHLPADADNGTILVVNDLSNNRELVRSILEPFGYRIELAGSAAEALALLADTPFDLIISDLHMPGMDGWKFLAAVHDDPRLSAIPFVFLSASVWGGAERELALRHGAICFIHGPIEPHNFLAQIGDCLHRGRDADHPDR